MTIAISFFTGAGGLDIGIMKAGFDIRLAVEIERKYCETLHLNHPYLNVVKGDIMDYSARKVYEEANISMNEDIDLIFGGSPCQSFSTAGRRQAFSDPRGKAMLKFAELVNEIQPKAFLLENVKGLLSAALKHRPLKQRGKEHPPLSDEEQPGSALRYLLSRFTGYNIKYNLINAANYGVPQTRERVFIVGIRSDLGIEYEFPHPTHHRNPTKGQKKWITVGEVLSNIDIKEHHYLPYTEERLKFMRLIPKGGGNWRDLPIDVVEQAMGGAYHSGGGKVGYYRRLWVDKPSPTLMTSPNQKSTNLGHPYEDRPLSIEEYKAIQGFPLDYHLVGSLSEQYVQIGNAVPIKLAEIIGQSIFESLQPTLQNMKSELAYV